jgi:hypothetical protein
MKILAAALCAVSFGCGDDAATGDAGLRPDAGTLDDAGVRPDDAAIPDAGAPPSCEAPSPAAESPVVFWPRPVRAHPAVPFELAIVAYDPAGSPLCFAIEDAPAAMTIDAAGTLRWTPSEADVAASPHRFRVHVTTSAGGRVTIDASMTVSTSDFVFVSPDGDDGASGALDAPFATIERGLEALDPSGPHTVVVRGGTYRTSWEWERDGVHTPLTGKRFTETEPAEVLGYPGERPIIECQSGHGLWAFATRYVIFRNFEVRGASSGERGGAIASAADHVLFQHVTVRDSDWCSSSNVTGFLLNGVDLVVHRCEARDNYDRSCMDGAGWNSSNYLAYTEVEGSSIAILESVSSGSPVGFKLKHGGPGTLLLHGVRDDGSDHGFGGMDDGLSIRFSTFADNDTGVALGITDPSEHVNAGDVLVEHVTVARATGVGISIQSSYPADGVVLRSNVVTLANAPAARDEGPNVYRFWPYDDPAPDAALTSDGNCFHAPAGDNAFRVGDAYLDFGGLGARDHDGASVWADPELDASLRIGAASACRIDPLPGAHAD